jgi:hypothetical protein
MQRQLLYKSERTKVDVAVMNILEDNAGAGVEGV